MPGIGIGLSADYGGSGAPAPFDPTTLTGCKLWLRADDATTITQSASRVSAWRDKSGNAHDFAQAIGASQPLYVAGAVGGRAAVKFDANDDRLIATNFAAPQPQTLWLVIRADTWASTARFIDTATAATFVIGQEGTTPQIQCYAGAGFACTSSALVVGAFGVLRAVANGASSSIRVGSGALATGNPGTNGWGTSGSMNLGSGAANNSALVSYAEVILFDHVQAGADDAAVLTGLQAFYGL